VTDNDPGWNPPGWQGHHRSQALDKLDAGWRDISSCVDSAVRQSDFAKSGRGGNGGGCR